MYKIFITKTNNSLYNKSIIFPKSMEDEIENNKDKIFIITSLLNQKRIPLSSDIEISYSSENDHVELSFDLAIKLMPDHDIGMLHIATDDIERKKVYITGDQLFEIGMMVNELGKLMDVRWAVLNDGHSYRQFISNAFDDIEWADIIHIFTKPSGEDLNDQLICEIEYADRLKKTIYIHNLHENNVEKIIHD